MRGLGSLAGLLIVAIIGGLIYKYELTGPQSAGVATPTQTIDIVGVKNDLLAIAQAERNYGAQHGSFVSLPDLTSRGEMSIAKSGRDGYTYEVQTEPNNFHAIAHCPAAAIPGCASYSIDQTMELQNIP
jgi:hypothetical protein